MIKWGGSYSSPFSACNGVRQGGVVSPVLFSVYMHELDAALCKAGVGCNIAGIYTNHILYADDMCVLCVSAKALRVLLNECNSFSDSHDILYNVCVIIKPKSYKSFDPPKVYLNGIALDYVTHYTYLGHILSDEFSDNADIKCQRRKLCVRANSLIRKFRNCSNDIKSSLFKAFIGGIYCCQLWSVYKKSVFNSIRTMYNNSFRWLMHFRNDCCERLMFVSHNAPSFGEVLRKAVYSFKCRLEMSENMLIKTVVNSDMLVPSSILHELRAMS